MKTFSISGGVLTLALLAAASTSSALDPSKDLGQHIHEQWDSRHGLPQNSVNGVVQGPRHYLWMATYDGLVRFDGVRFERQPNDGLPGNRLRIVGHDADGFWVGGEHGGLSRPDGQRAEPFDLAAHGIEGSVSQVKPGEQGLWIAGSRGLFLIPPDGQVRAFGPDQGLPHPTVWQIALLHDQNLILAGTRDGLGVARLDDLESGFEPIDNPQLRGRIVSALLPEPDGSVLVGHEEGLLRIRPDAALPRSSLEATPIEALDGKAVRALLRDRNNSLWIGTWTDGIHRITDDGAQRMSRAEGLSANRITALLEDREGILWFGTDGGGLARFRDGYATAYGGEAWDMPSTSVTSLVEHPDGGLWVGLNCAGIARFNGGIEARIDGADGLGNTCVFSLMVDADDRLWAGTFGGGVYRIEDSGPVPVPVPEGFDIVLSLAQGEDGGVLAGTSRGLMRLRPGQDGFETVPGADFGPIHTIHTGPAGRLWLATLEGLRIGTIEAGFESLGRNELGHTRAIHHDARGQAWIGTYGNGLFRYADGELIALGTEHGLVEPVASRILVDDSGHFWISGNRGIQSVPVDQLNAVADGRAERFEVLHIGERDGMRSVETTGGSQPAGIRTRAGRLWFPTVDGIVRIDPHTVERNSLPPPVHIERLVVDGVDMPIDGTAKLPADAGQIEIHYTGLSLTVPERVRFRYRLGEDSPWIEAGNRRVAYFSSLPPGAQRFEVIAANPDGVWNEDGDRLELYSKPGFRRTLWFPLSLFALGLAVVGLVSGAWIINARRRERQLAELVTERTRALEDANRRLENLARVDGLTGLANRRHLDESLAELWQRSSRIGEELAVIVIDIDHFKRFNDSHGHLAGDDCLRAVGGALRACLKRKPDLLARYGGEEFVAVLPGTSAEDAGRVAERMLAAVAALDIVDEDGTPAGEVTVSAGVAAARPAGDPVAARELLERADRALYEAKATGRNTLELAD